MKNAGFWLRVKAFLYDYILIFLYLILVVGMGVTLLTFIPNFEEFFYSAWRGQVLGFFMMTLPVSLYFILSESSPTQATWGKKRMGLKVTDRAGNRLNKGQAVVRTAVKFLPWELAHTGVQHASRGNEATWVGLVLVLVWVLVILYAIVLIVSPTHETPYDWASGSQVMIDKMSY